ncbi:protein kinase family protein [Cellulomonas sp. NTE-D12]|uniref:protein kinase family protein n=1 Tax=Cellulomonas sp. NTE-D12 TaxID=2962632 RepID=UPI003081D0F7
MSGARRTSLPMVRELRVDQVGRGTLLAGRYRVLEPQPSTVPVLQTWAAVDEILDRPVRAQVLAPESSTAGLDAARRAALVTDPRLLRVLDVGTHDGLGYVVTEQVSGPSLAQLVVREPLTADQARAVIGEASAALEVARRRGVHHQALRPSAICVADDGRVLVSGLALDAALLGRVEGDARSTSRTDAVDLVRLLYTALTGRWPGPAAAADGLPVAPVVDGVPVPPADLVTAVPADLDTLCSVTLGPYDDGPHSPAEVVRELEPWGEIRISRPSGHLGAAAAAAAGALAGAAAAGAVAPDAEGPAAGGPPPRVQRQSVRSAFSQSSAGTNRPGTPPPAAPGRTSAFPVVGQQPPSFAASAAPPARPPFPEPGAAVTGAAAAGAAAAAETRPMTPAATTPPPAFPPTAAAANQAPVRTSSEALRATAPQRPVQAATPPVVAAATGPATGRGAAPLPPAAPPAVAPAAVPPAVPREPEGQDDDPFDFGRVREEPVGRRRFDPTVIVLAVVVLLVIIGVAFAAKSLLSGPSAHGGAGTASHSHSASPSASASGPGTPSASSSASAAPAGGAPVIASGASVDANGTEGDHPEAVAKAFDGDPSTFWVSRTYKSASFGGLKQGIGYVITLKQATSVSSVTLHTNGTGGTVEIRATDASNPGGGTVLASGPLSGNAAFTLKPPTATSTLSLWFTELPSMPDGSFRVELTEVQLG